MQIFLVVNTTVLHGRRLVESVVVEPWMQRVNSKLYVDFRQHGELVALALKLFEGQLYTYNI